MLSCEEASPVYQTKPVLFQVSLSGGNSGHLSLFTLGTASVAAGARSASGHTWRPLGGSRRHGQGRACLGTAVQVKVLLSLPRWIFSKERADKALGFLTVGLHWLLQISHLTIKTHSALNWEMCSTCIGGSTSNLLGSERHQEEWWSEADVFCLPGSPRTVVSSCGTLSSGSLPCLCSQLPGTAFLPSRIPHHPPPRRAGVSILHSALLLAVFAGLVLSLPHRGEGSPGLWQRLGAKAGAATTGAG